MTDPRYVQNGEGMMEEGAVYLCAFRTNPEYHQKIYEHWGFTELLKSGEETYPDETVIDVEYYGKKFIRYSSGDRAQSIVIAYELKPVGGELFCDQVETKELKYFSKENKPQLFTKSHDDLWEDIFG